MNVEGGATCITLALGQEIVELLQFDCPGRPYPARSSACDLLFQHFAIVAADMPAAWQRLRGVKGWSSITRDEPQRLPKTSGGVTAFKFRDPEGHPLELLAFPAANTPSKWRGTGNRGMGNRGTGNNATSLGIDHSAISIADTAVSIAFYQALNLRISARSFNQGPEQDMLDDVRGAQVEVTALSAPTPSPHVELLCYRGHSHKPPAIRSNDIAATRLAFALCGPARAELDPIGYGILDPDGHHLVIEAPSPASNYA
jgi:catechol 2,3-dioxygenase-like lactoylglutathione lyase family enzyme